jgi:hypothetical protein
MVATVRVRDLAHVILHILALNGNVVAPVANKRPRVDGICLFLNLSVNVGELTNEFAPVANKALHGFVPALQSGCILNKIKRLSFMQYFKYIFARLSTKHVEVQEN